MILIGFKPKGLNTEQHDVRFEVGVSIKDPAFQKRLRENLPFGKDVKIHIDAVIEISHADGYDVVVVPKSHPEKSEKNLWFVNLGGYKNGVFHEFHKRLLLVEEKVTDAIIRALKDQFVSEMDTPHEKARPHHDDSLNVSQKTDGVAPVDADDHINVGDELGEFSIFLIKVPGGKDSLNDPDSVNVTGYMKIEV